ncbi:acetoacetate decarboxylase family protein [Conexibacter sp. JD483]|uniref:acetoacetate decarboxylase family protein n=1 Tax=unclassified Conexibacter TaxID=2627773 RepID=UPI00271DF61B|nr:MULTISPECIES: acetoacetate decarboxylase family protein [unclassified Conexibacter]MDO8187454.1 acetoacetate decarboxylase family protein [Conexibacter sp. CPCC 205706]MDO8198688.1 acetoacetate decarboxylase family protein [Conexibacter sp. CPCC 205762]MDR9369866.1 acetoacetate decarboxylase family protein [Conexibacter sp. JD483]
MSLHGYSLPRSPLGQANLVPSPPWHYVGDFLVIDYWADPAAVAAVLPDGVDPHPDGAGRCSALFVDWQSCSDGGEELLDPSRSQYKEFFLVVNAQVDGEDVTICPYIWVDQDFALARGWIQGFPKKLGDIWITRKFDLANAAAPSLAPGARFGGTCSARGRRLAEGRITLTGESATGAQHNDAPLVNVRYFPRLAAGRHDEPAVHELVKAKSYDRSVTPAWEGDAELELFEAPGEEHTALAPVRVGKGYRFTFAYTIDDLESVKDLSGAEVAS